MISKIKIDIVNVSKEFNHKKEKKLALDHVSLQICEDQIYCLLGHNGKIFDLFYFYFWNIIFKIDFENYFRCR